MNQEAFWKRQYEKNIGRMVGVCYRYVADLPLAEDLAHDAFLKAIEKSDTYHATGKFDNWLMKIAVNEALMHLRHCPEMVEADETLFEQEDSSEESPIVEMDFTQEELLAMIHELPMRQRTVFNLYALEHFTHAQIAESVGISVANSKVLLSRARQQLQQMLLAKAREKEKKRKGLFMLLFLFMRSRHNAQSLDNQFDKGLSGLKCTPKAKLSDDEVKAAVAASPGGAGIAIASHKVALGIGAAACLAGIAGLTYFALREPAQTPPSEQEPIAQQTVIANDCVANETAEQEFVPIVENKVSESIYPNAENSSNSPVFSHPIKESEPTETEKIVVTKVVPVHETIVIRDTVTRRDTVWVP